MGGPGSGRKSPKALAIFALLGAQMKIQELVYDGFDSNKPRDQLREIAVEAAQQLKTAQEEIERS